MSNQHEVFEPVDVFHALYRDPFRRAITSGVMAFDESKDVVLRGGFIGLIENHFVDYFNRCLQGTQRSSADIHRENTKSFQEQWQSIYSTSTCLCCLRRRPQYSFSCGHCICEHCVIVFGSTCPDDPWLVEVRECFLCGIKTPSKVVVKLHPPTAGIGVLCIDGGGVRGIMPLKLMKMIQDRIGLLFRYRNSSRWLSGLALASIRFLFYVAWC